MKRSVALLSLSLLALGCQKELTDPGPSSLLPVITTTAASSISNSSAISGGDITSDGGNPVTERGVCWSITVNPTISNSHTSDGTGIGTFTSSITGLLPATTYHIRAYATNSDGTAYGNEITILTLSGPTLPTVITSAASAINATSITGGGNVTLDGGVAITARGVCWGTAHNPVITGTHTTDGSGTGSFSSNITPLLPSTTYYLRAYATNSIGTAYGNEITVTTLDHDVYIGGSSMPGMHNIATYWKNGVPTTLTDGTQEAYVFSICVVNEDVYAGGLEHNGSFWVAKLWKNGVPTTLSDGTSNAEVHSVAVVGTDVYVGGADHGFARTWKNGVGTTLPDGTHVSSIFVSGTDLYACGDYYNYPISYALFWKNGVFADLTNRSTVSNATSVYVSGTDVYVGGRENMVAKIWKNGTPITMSNGIDFNMINSITVNGTDVYAGGYEIPATTSIQVAKYWKNGVATTLTTGITSAAVSNIFVFGTDLFACGQDDGNIKIWKNGVPIAVNVTPSQTWVIYMK